MTHRIHRQIIELALPAGTDAEAQSRRAATLFEEKVLPQLDELFSRLAPGKRILRIPQLEIDLGAIDLTHWERDFVEACIAQISAALRNFAMPGTTASEALSLAGTELSPEEDARQTLIYFLEKGRLPWHALGRSLSELEAPLSGPLPAPFAHTLTALLRRRPEALQRMVWQSSPAWIQSVFEKIHALPPGWMAQTLKQMRQLRRQSAQPTVVTAHREAGAYLLQICRALLHTPVAKVSSLSPEQAARQWAVHAPITPSHTSPQAPHAAQDPIPAPLSPAASVSPTPDKPLMQSAETPRPGEAPESLAVENAGIVLLGPYLQAFFGELELLQGVSFADEMAQYRAVFLLHFLATGEQNPDEPTLVLQKILCGLPAEAPIPAHIPLSAAEKSESFSLLEAVIRNWPALKNTSPEGLRQAFLQRQGSLRFLPDPYGLLQVERKGQDLLLERLPWSYSVIRLPWMGGVMRVTW